MPIWQQSVKDFFYPQVIEDGNYEELTVSDTYFLQPINPNPDSNPNFATAEANATFTQYSQSPVGSSVTGNLDGLVKGGVSKAIINAEASFYRNDPAFSQLFTEIEGEIEAGAAEIKAKSETKIVASFVVGANETFSFNFVTDIDLTTKEIENAESEFALARARTRFLVIDSEDVENAEIIDYFGLSGKLVPTKNQARVRTGSSGNVDINNNSQDVDLDGNNGTDSIFAAANGYYERTFTEETQITIVELNTSRIRLREDGFLNNLGDDVIYGTTKGDNLRGTSGNDKIYGGLGNDKIRGLNGDDIIEGGIGKDKLFGGKGNDSIHGSLDDDIIAGGKGSDVLVGGDGNDKFVFKRRHSLAKGELDIIKDFESGKDKLEFHGWGNVNPVDWFSSAVDEGKFVDTSDGALFTADSGGQILFEDVNLGSLDSSDFVFS